MSGANGKPYMTTGDVARLVGCAPRTAAKWADSGLLPCRRLPGSGADRRFRPADVERFLAAHGMADLLGGPPRVLLLGVPPQEACALVMALPGGWQAERAADLFTLGLLLERHGVSVRGVLVDCRGVGRREALAAGPAVRAALGTGGRLVALLGPEEAPSAAWAGAGYAACVQAPADPAAVAGLLAGA